MIMWAETVKDFWDFCDFLKEKNRFVLNKKWERYVENIIDSAQKRNTLIIVTETIY